VEDSFGLRKDALVMEHRGTKGGQLKVVLALEG
jgi:hypothetical protein